MMPTHHKSDEADGKAKETGSTLASWYRMAGVGIEFCVAVLLFGAIGWWLDRKFGSRPWLMLAGGGIGFAAGLWMLIRVARKSFRE